MPTRRCDLVSFLARNPYCSHSLLLDLFGSTTLPLLLAQSANQLRTLPLRASGVCYALRDEPLSLLPGLRRLERARGVAVDLMGADALRSGVSPGWQADLELLWHERWWRIWVDAGGCFPGVPGFIRQRPAGGAGVSDLILAAAQERVPVLAGLLTQAWQGNHPVRVLHPESGCQQAVHPSGSPRQTWNPPGPDQIPALIRQRRHTRVRQGSLAAQLDPEDYRLLAEVGDLPLLTAYELAYLPSDQLEPFRRRLARLAELEDLGLLHTARSPLARDQLEERKVLTPRALGLLAAHWGCSAEQLCRVQPWPLAVNRAGQPQYQLNWLQLFGDHYRLVRQAALALLAGARAVSGSLGGAEVQLQTTIAGRFILPPSRRPAAHGKRGWLQPDAVLTARLYQRGWLDGTCTAPARPGPHGTLLLEVDRGTMAYARLVEKLDRYQQHWPFLAARKPHLVWVIDGSPYRESWLLQAMAQRGLTGWTARLADLALPQEDPWWLSHFPAALDQPGLRLGLMHASVGGLAPWRPVWRTPSGRNPGPLLGAQPWQDRGLQRVVRQPAV